MQYYAHGSLFSLLQRALKGEPRAVRELSWGKRLEMLRDVAAGEERGPGYLSEGGTGQGSTAWGNGLEVVQHVAAGEDGRMGAGWKHILEDRELSTTGQDGARYPRRRPIKGCKHGRELVSTAGK